MLVTYNKYNSQSTTMYNMYKIENRQNCVLLTSWVGLLRDISKDAVYVP